MNKLAVITGATSGIGKALVALCLKAEIDVIGLARSQDKADQVKEEFKDYSKARLQFVFGDLKDNQSAKKAGDDIAFLIKHDYQGRLDILMNVAGIVTSGYHENADGHEMTFAVNHLSVFIITQKLLPCLKKSSDPRVLVVSSLSHYRARMNWNNIESKKGYNILKAYKTSKLYNVFFVKEFSRRIPGISIYAIDPGLVNTELGLKNTTWLAYTIWNWRRNKGTDTSYPTRFMIDIATKPEYLALSGHYLKEGKSVPPNPVTLDPMHAKRLWEYTEKCTSCSYEHLV